jgi:hypothetical protein
MVMYGPSISRKQQPDQVVGCEQRPHAAKRPISSLVPRTGRPRENLPGVQGKEYKRQCCERPFGAPLTFRES